MRLLPSLYANGHDIAYTKKAIKSWTIFEFTRDGCLYRSSISAYGEYLGTFEDNRANLFLFAEL